MWSLISFPYRSPWDNGGVRSIVSKEFDKIFAAEIAKAFRSKEEKDADMKKILEMLRTRKHKDSEETIKELEERLNRI